MRWEEYVLLDEPERAVVRFMLMLGMWQGEVQAILLAYALTECGITWDADAGQFVRRE